MTSTNTYIHYATVFIVHVNAACQFYMWSNESNVPKWMTFCIVIVSAVFLQSERINLLKHICVCSTSTESTCGIYCNYVERKLVTVQIWFNPVPYATLHSELPFTYIGCSSRLYNPIYHLCYLAHSWTEKRCINTISKDIRLKVNATTSTGNQI